MAKPIAIHTPERREGQHNVLGLTTEPLPVVRVGIVGLGERGMKAVRRFCDIDHACVTAVCDVSPQRADEASQLLGSLGQSANVVAGVDAYKDLCRLKEVDLIYICTDWTSHVDVACEAMLQGKHTAIEVPAAMTIDDCWKLIDTAETTQCHCTMLENCCYDFFEMAVREMVRQGLLGEIVHAEGGYAHPLGEHWTRWRLDINRQQRGDIYPTHGFGPICQWLDIHRSDRLDYLVSMDSAPLTGPTTYREHLGTDAPDFQNADQTSTLIRTRRGRSILLQHNVLTPRPYSRMMQAVGTKAMMDERDFRRPEGYTERAAELEPYLPEWVLPLREKATKYDRRGGMTYFMDWRLVDCLHRGAPLDIDVYDLAEWCSVSELSRISIENGSMPVAFPDFTRSIKI